jgi:hypothetical protein
MRGFILYSHEGTAPDPLIECGPISLFCPLPRLQPFLPRDRLLRRVLSFTHPIRIVSRCPYLLAPPPRLAATTAVGAQAHAGRFVSLPPSHHRAPAMTEWVPTHPPRSGQASALGPIQISEISDSCASGEIEAFNVTTAPPLPSFNTTIVNPPLPGDVILYESPPASGLSLKSCGENPNRTTVGARPCSRSHHAASSALYHRQCVMPNSTRSLIPTYSTQSAELGQTAMGNPGWTQAPPNGSRLANHGVCDRPGPPRPRRLVLNARIHTQPPPFR